MVIYALMSKPITNSMVGGGVIVALLGVGLLANAVQLDRTDRSHHD